MALRNCSWRWTALHHFNLLIVLVLISVIIIMVTAIIIVVIILVSFLLFDSLCMETTTREWI